MTQLARSLLKGPKQFAQPTRDSSQQSGVTELVLSHDCPEHASLLFPMLAYLSRQAQDQWITWVAPKGINQALLSQYGVDTRKIRLVHASKAEDVLWITWEALAAGNSHTVIASPGKLSDKEFRDLEGAAHKGQSQGLLLRLR